MANHFYDLKNDNYLPLGAKFIDPYDNSTFLVSRNETLSNFTNLINKSRADKNYPILEKDHLRSLIVASLLETTPTRDVPKYFERKTMSATLTQMFGFARSVVNERLTKNTVSTVQMKNRLENHCKGCKLRKAHSSWGISVNKIVDKTMGLSDDKESDKVINIQDNSGISKNQEDSIGTCNMCGCGLKKKIKITNQSALVGVAPEQLDKLLKTYGEKAFDVCWIINEALASPVGKKLLQAKLRSGKANGEILLNKYLSSKKR